MRTLHLYADRQAGDFVQGIAATNSVSQLSIVQDNKVQLVIHSLVRNTTPPVVTPYVEEPLAFSSMRASIGLIDAAPRAGTFKLKVGAQTTNALTWPTSFADAAAIATWKATVRSAIEGLSNVGAGAVRLDDPTGTPGHIFYFTWTDLNRADVIEVAENRLLPACEVTHKPAQTPAGYTQQMKLAHYPLAMTTAFARPYPPVATLSESRPGSVGVNEEQTLFVPSTATGSLSLSWSGVSTRTIEVTAITAAALQVALNAIVPAGATNPSFRVEDRKAPGGKGYAIEFIGPLGGAAQVDLGVAMHAQQPRPYAIGTLNLRDNFGIEQALNGKPSVELMLELVIDDEETILKKVVIVNDMTTPDTVPSAEADGLIATRDVTVYVDSGLGEAYAEAAPGLVFTPPSAGNVLELTHNLGTFQPAVRVALRVSTSPEYWLQVPDNEYEAKAITANIVRVTFAVTFNEVGGDPLNVANVRIYVGSPDAKIIVFSHEHTWAQIRESLPSGQTLAAKLAAIDTALGMVGGTLAIPASSITGLIKASQIDISEVSTTLATNAKFLETFRQVITDSTVITALSETLKTSASFLETLKVLVQDSTFIDKLTESLSSSSTFVDEIRTTVLDVLQTGAAGPVGFTLFDVPAFEVQIPPPQSIPSPPRLTPVEVQIETTVVDGDNKKVETTKGTADLASPQRIPVYAPLPTATVLLRLVGVMGSGGATLNHYTGAPPVMVGSVLRVGGTEYAVTAVVENSPTGDGFDIHYDITLAGDASGIEAGTLTYLSIAAPNASGALAAAPGDGSRFTITADATSKSYRGQRGRTFRAGDKVIFRSGFYFRTVEIAGTLYPAEMEQTIALMHVNSTLLYAGARFLLDAPVYLRLDGNVSGRGALAIETGAYGVNANGGLNLASITRTAAHTLPVTLSATGVRHSVGLVVSRASGGALSAAVRAYGRETTVSAPGSANFAVRLRFTQFDLEDVPDPRGSLLIRASSTIANVAALN